MKLIRYNLQQFFFRCVMYCSVSLVGRGSAEVSDDNQMILTRFVFSKGGIN
jgi:hypothetical protein